VRAQRQQTTFANFEKNVRLWEFETDTPTVKQAVKLLRGLDLLG
jgi:hypothetical protein